MTERAHRTLLTTTVSIHTPTWGVTATDPRFVVEKDETPAEDEANNTEVAEEPAEQPTEGAAESEESSEATEEPAEPAGDETAAAESETPNTETV